MIILWAGYALFLGDIKNGPILCTVHAFLAVKKGVADRAVRDIFVTDASLIILFDQVINSHVAQNPVLCIDVCLEDGRAQDDIH